MSGLLAPTQAERDRAQIIADELIGTCKSLHDVMSDAEQDNTALLEAVYELCFECDCCGWWADVEALNNYEGQEFDEICDECASEHVTLEGH